MAKNEARGIKILGALVILLILFRVFVYPHIATVSQ